MKQITQLKLEHSTEALLREFSQLPGEEVVHEIETVTESLLVGARFDDYIPVLAHRFARDHLRDRPARHVFAAAA